MSFVLYRKISAVFPRFFSVISAVFPRKRAMFLGGIALFFGLGKLFFGSVKISFGPENSLAIVWLSFPPFAAAAVASLLFGFAGEGCRRVLRLGGFVVGSVGHYEV